MNVKINGMSLLEIELMAWRELPENLRQEAIQQCRELPRELLKEVHDGVRKYGASNWVTRLHPELEFYSFHFYEGMGIRNFLRKKIPDSKLPSGNWDDYYIQAVEHAAELEIGD